MAAIPRDADGGHSRQWPGAFNAVPTNCGAAGVAEKELFSLKSAVRGNFWYSVQLRVSPRGPAQQRWGFAHS